MPFITKEARKITDTIGPQTVGDKCFLCYREMLKTWRQSPRWTTAHEIHNTLITTQFDTEDDMTAAMLAWQVFFQLHVMPYELQKRIDNGEVETGNV